MKTLWLLLCSIFCAMPALAADKRLDVPANLKLPITMQRCTTPLDCGYVDVSCNRCCVYEAVSLKERDNYLRERADRCKGLASGPACEQCLNRGQPLLSCINNRCVLSYGPATGILRKLNP